MMTNDELSGTLSIIRISEELPDNKCGLDNVYETNEETVNSDEDPVQVPMI